MSEETPVNVPNYLWQSIVVTILCCLPLGIPAIIFAAKVNGLVAQGNIAEAQEASRKAKMFCWISLGLGIVGGIIQIVLQLGVIGAAAAAEGMNY
ncbi:MAG: CD225/dispanin family protein [Pontiellaceae bacterium]|nr:CD225/dispanin family protein [Pontiellaceae bacterium]MBN2784831.1 CD225/dispanin family protein [Pontiellaceae bacterium]